MAKPKIRIRARKKRKDGESIKQIAKLLSVSSSTVSLWCRDIHLTADQRKALEKRAKDPYYGKRLDYVRLQQKKRLDKIKQLKKEGIQDIGLLNHREMLCAGVCLYWAEGFKKDNQVGFSNSDPGMVTFFL